MGMEFSDFLKFPLLNKGTAFTREEREELQIDGFLPYHVSTLQEQAQRRYINFKSLTNDISKYVFLTGLQNRNERLFYKLVYDHISEMLPIIYTPTVGDAALHYSVLYTHERGIYISYPLRDKIEEIIERIPRESVDVAVVTDGKRILGLGDLGVGGMTIPIGKLSLYTLFGGIHPARTLPILLDVGTDNEVLLSDPLYIGWRHRRISGGEYDAFVDRFVQALKKRYPGILLQWEDFGKEHAEPLLKRYQKQLCSFNDDIQGTATVVTAAIYALIKRTHSSPEEQRIVILGAGSAGTGIAQMICGAFEQTLSPQEAARKLYLIDIQGLIHEGQKEVQPQHRLFARPKEEIGKWKVRHPENITLSDVIEHVRPTVLIGVSTQAGAFTEEIVTKMAKYVDMPAIFPLSNPTTKSEAHPADLIRWTKGRVIIATGSPYDPVTYEGKVYSIAQCNNVNIFPGVGLGLIASKAKEATDKMFYKAAEILGHYSPLLHNPFGTLFPPFEALREVSYEIAVAIVKVALESNLAQKEISDPRKAVLETMWTPDYS